MKTGWLHLWQIIFRRHSFAPIQEAHVGAMLQPERYFIGSVWAMQLSLVKGDSLYCYCEDVWARSTSDDQATTTKTRLTSSKRLKFSFLYYICERAKRGFSNQYLVIPLYLILDHMSISEESKLLIEEKSKLLITEESKPLITEESKLDRFARSLMYCRK